VNQRYSGIAGELARTEAISQAQPAAHVAQRPGLLNTAAAGLSRRGVMAAKAELANSVLLQLCKVLYESDTDGQAANIDPHGGRVLIPLPWGGMGHKKWRLRPSEARTLRYIMFNRTAADDPAPLLDYDADGRHWFLSLSDYPSLRRALAYLHEHPITVDEWRAAWRATRSGWAVKALGNE
jgi:hypothetical protein